MQRFLSLLHLLKKTDVIRLRFLSCYFAERNVPPTTPPTIAPVLPDPALAAVGLELARLVIVAGCCTTVAKRLSS
jgi:hypothetical protein